MEYLYRLIRLMTILSISMPILALDVKIVDQNGEAVKDAYVAIPQGQIESPSQTAAVMDQVDVAFVPHVLAIDQGQEVIFPNSDNIRHHVYSFSDPKKFEIKLYQGVPKQPILFENPGLVALGCNIHDSMLGYIYVSPWPDYGVSDEKGLVSLSQSSTELAIWHPRLKGSQGLIRKEISPENQSPIVVSLDLKKQKKKRKFGSKRRKHYDF